jgi:SAM-dependent methyltransferase
MGAHPQVAVQGAKPPFKTRFKAWWEGTDLPAPMIAPTPASSAPTAVAKTAAAELPVIDRPAIKVAQQLWGEGFVQPGGAELILTLVKPLAINNSMTVMDFGAGLGGGTRAVSEEFDVWVQGQEGDLKTAEAAQAISTKKGVKRAEIKPYRAQEFQPKPGSCDCIFSHATLYKLQEKEKLLGQFERTLKTRGQLSMTDFVRAPGIAADDPRLREFAAAEGSSIWLDEDYKKQFKALKFDIRVDEDLTAGYRAGIINAWVGFTSDPPGLACAKAYPEEAVAEVALWTRRIAALDSGALQLRRYYGIKMGANKVD